MPLPKPKFAPLRRSGRKSACQPSSRPASPSAVEHRSLTPAREPGDEHAASQPADFGWRVSSYELKQGLDVVELPSSLPPDVLDRLFNAPKR